MSVEKLLEELNPQINYLSNDIKIPGMDKDDVAQELRIMVLVDYKKLEKQNKNISELKKGWWFKRLKWYTLNLLEKEKKEPVNRSVRIEVFNKKH